MCHKGAEVRNPERFDPKYHNIIAICPQNYLRLWIELSRCLVCLESTKIKFESLLEQWQHMYPHAAAAAIVAAWRKWVGGSGAPLCPICS